MGKRERKLQQDLRNAIGKLFFVEEISFAPEPSEFVIHLKVGKLHYSWDCDYKTVVTKRGANKILRQKIGRLVDRVIAYLEYAHLEHIYLDVVPNPMPNEENRI